jgi:hypothetical protein
MIAYARLQAVDRGQGVIHLENRKKEKKISIKKN